MFLYSLMAIGGVFIVGRAVGRALFLSTLSQAEIPYKFLLPPFVIVMAVALYTRIAGRYRLDQVTVGTNALMIGVLLVFRLLLGTRYGTTFAVLAALFVFLELMATLIGIQFWTFAGEIFDPREAKRLFGLIAAGGTVANVIAGGMLTTLASAVAPKNLIFMVIIAVAVCIWCARVLGRIQRTIPVAPAGKPRDTGQPSGMSFLQGIRELGGSPLLLTISGIMMIMSLVTNITDYQLDLALQATYAGDGQRMVGFLGSFALVSGLIACLLQFFATNRILERFGIFMALLVLPVGIALGSSLVLLSGGVLLAVVLPRASDMVFRYTINDTSINLLFLPVPAGIRRRTKATLEGVVKPPIIGALGLLFLVLSNVQGFTVVHWTLPVIGLVSLWIVLVLRVRGQYIGALTDNVQKRRINLAEETLDISDETTVKVLASTLKHHDDLRVLHALHLISSVPTVDWTLHIAPLLGHSSPEVIIAAVSHLAHTGNAKYSVSIAALFGNPHEDVRAAAIVAFCALDGQKATSSVVPFLQHSSLHLKGAAIVGLIKYGGLDGILHAAEQLKRMIESHEPHTREEGARVLGALHVPTFYHPLIGLFDDEYRAVQLSTIRAAGELRAPELLPHLVRKLGSKATARAAAQALIAYGSGGEPVLAATLANRDEARDVRVQVPKVLQHLATAQGAAMLLAQLEEPDEVVRTSIYRALAGLRSHMPFEVKADAIRAALQSELRSAYALTVVQADLALDKDNLLTDALVDRRNRTFRRIFFLLDILYPGQSLEPVHQALQREHNAMRATAIELLDNLVDREIKEILIPLIDAPDERVVGLAWERFELPATSRIERLDQLARDGDPWLRSCAITCIGALSLTELYGTVQEALSTEDDLVRETAMVTCRDILDPTRLREVVAEQAAIASARNSLHTPSFQSV